MSTVLWTLEEALVVVRALEKVVKPQGFHVALGGGTLMRGSSTKDLDLFFYPHRTTESETPEFKRLRGILTTLGGVTDIKDCKHCYDHKEVFSGKILGKRVDLFFLS